MDDNSSENPYASPTAQAAPAGLGAGGMPDPSQDDIDLTRPTGLVKAGAFLTVATGLLTAAVGFQLVALVTIVDRTLRLVPYPLLAGGAATAWLGWKTLKTRGWAAWTATIVDAFIALALGYWVLLTAASGFFSLFALVLPPLALVATVFAALSIGPCRRADAARARLRESGVDMAF